MILVILDVLLSDIATLLLLPLVELVVSLDLGLLVLVLVLVFGITVILEVGAAVPVNNISNTNIKPNTSTIFVIIYKLIRNRLERGKGANQNKDFSFR
jgi:hypothetical protein